MKTVELGEVSRIETGTTPSMKNPEYHGGNVPFVKPGELSDQPKVIFEANSYVTEIGAEQGRLIPKNGVMVCCIGSLGKLAIAGREMITNQQINSVIFNEDVVDPKFGAYFLSTQKRELEHIASSTTVAIVNKTNFSKLKIPLPSLSEQKAIVAKLDRAQRLIDIDKAMLAKYDQLIQSVFLEMFGDPVTNPKGWEVRELDEISIQIRSGTTPKGGKKVYVEDGILFLRSQNVWRKRLDLSDVAYIDDKTHLKMINTSLKTGDILMTKTGRFNTENSSLGRAAMYRGEDDKANLNGHVYLIRLLQEINNEFVLYILTTEQYRDYIRRVCVGGIDKRQINKSHLEEFPIINPPIDQQKKFTDFMIRIEQEKRNTKESLNKSKDLFNGLIQKTFGR